ncbi:MAG: pyruvate kinase [Candidatus Marinimicrobia bacterium]|nr:pyruvate kinase [Candidatus Neomarinimicrobiota bacterium]|tara:strand:+ start:1333 stop:2742 length:1410 start_codon:yes stop_codon:yes gene_type:complete
MKRTKIIATLGPASDSSVKIRELIQAGMDVARINMSHTQSKEYLSKLVKNIRTEARKSNRSVSVLMDLAGPKLRVKRFSTDKSIYIKEGKTYSIGYKNADIPIDVNLKFKSIEEGASVKIDDGNISFSVIEHQNNILKLIAKNSGKITSGKGVNFPGITLNIPAVTEKDLSDLEIALDLEVDWIAMSFVRNVEDSNPIIDVFKKKSKSIPMIAKIEKPEALENLSIIVDHFDGILVARGDLGVEMPLQELPILQKKIVNRCLKKRKPVIIATQMLETMIENPTPTRAEVNDVANAIYDGADAVMLSGETAVGKYPIETLNIMSAITKSVEKDFDQSNFNRNIQIKKSGNIDNRQSIAHAVYTLANDMNINHIVIMTESGETAKQMALFRPDAIIYALCPNWNVCRELNLIWGIIPVLVDECNSTDQMLNYSSSILKELKFLKDGDIYILTAGVPVGVSGTTNMLKIHEA